MIPEIGHYAAILALVVALVQGTLPLIGAARGDRSLMAIGTSAAITVFVLVAIAYACLTWAHVVSDFSVVNVVENSHHDKPLLYKIAGVWGNHEGSLMLWSLILALYGAAVALFGGNLPASLRARVLGVQAWIGVGFLAFMLLTSNPFLRIFPAPPDGNGLNPLLQDPGLAFHPPFLYLGYVGFSIAFAFAVAALIEGKVDPAWARWVRPWTLVAWCFLTIGITMGSWWAYYTLGWGGWWYWDPVENASLMPWLAGTALLHSAIVVEKRDTLKSWTILLAMLTFSLSLLGTFLVRSGVLTSVHAFAVDPKRGVFILGFLVLAVGSSLALYAWRAPSLKIGGLFAPLSREGSLVLNNLLLATLCGTVLLGTLYPLGLDALTGQQVSVGPPYFDSVVIPLMVPLVGAMAIGPLLSWKRADLAGALGRLKAAFILAALAALVTFWALHGTSLLPILGMVLAVWLLVGGALEFILRIRLFTVPLMQSLSRAWHLPRASLGMTIAHMGLGLTLLGITVSGTWSSGHLGVMKPGQTMAVGPYDFTLERTLPVKGPNFTARQAVFDVSRGGEPVTVLKPETRHFSVPLMNTTKAAIRSSPFVDLYAVVGDPDGHGGYAVRLYQKPMVSWIWLGGAAMMLGGAISLTDRRLRVGAPGRKRAPNRSARHLQEA